MRFVIKWGIYKNMEHPSVYSSDESVYDSLPPLGTPPVGLVTNSVIQR